MRSTLFRASITAAKSPTWHGNAILMQPISMRIVAAAIFIIAISSIVFLSQTNYTSHITAAGIVIPDRGVIKIQSPQSGIVLERHVEEGQQVHKGDILYVVSAEVMYAPESNAATFAGTTATQLQQMRVKQNLLKVDEINALAIEQREQDELKSKILSLQTEVQQLDREIAVQQERVNAKKLIYDRHAQAQAQGFLSPLALQQKYDELLDYQARLQSTQRTRLGLMRSVEDVRMQLDTVKQRNALAHSQRTRQAADLQEGAAVREANQRTLVTAPQDGIVTAILTEPGHRVAHETMLTILPRNSSLEVQVIVPSSMIGFIREKDPVTLRFDAFPYQRYGSINGSIREISQATLSAIDNAGVDPKSASDGFRVRIMLLSQVFPISNRDFPLRAGMKVEARFAQERRTLLSWLIDPFRVLHQ